MRLILALAAVLLAGPAMAQSDRQQAVAWCMGRGGTVETMIAGCSWLIRSEPATPDERVKALTIGSSE